MIDLESISSAITSDGRMGNIAIAVCKSSSGAVKEFAYSRSDRCFYVTVDGREKLRSDMAETAYRFFSGDAPQ